MYLPSEVVSINLYFTVLFYAMLGTINTNCKEGLVTKKYLFGITDVN